MPNLHELNGQSPRDCPVTSQQLSMHKKVAPYSAWGTTTTIEEKCWPCPSLPFGGEVELGVPASRGAIVPAKVAPNALLFASS